MTIEKQNCFEPNARTVCNTNTIAVLTFLAFLHCCEKKLERPKALAHLIASTDSDTVALGLSLIRRYRGNIVNLGKILYSISALSPLRG